MQPPSQAMPSMIVSLTLPARSMSSAFLHSAAPEHLRQETGRSN